MTTSTLLAPGLARLVDAVRLDVVGMTATLGPRSLRAANAVDLRAQVSAAIYREWHAGIRDDPTVTGRRRTLLDTELAGRLLAAVRHADSPTTVEVLSHEADGVVVDLGSARVRVPSRLLDPSRIPAAGSATVRLPAAHPALSPGFVLVDGPEGAEESPTARAVRRVFVHLLAPDVAPTAWGLVLEAANAVGGRYRAKVLSDRDGYPRRDALVVYHAEDEVRLPAAVAEAVAGLPGVGAEVSEFCARLAPGVGASSEPADPRPGMTGLSFGQHRARLVTAGLFEAAHTGTDRADAVARHLVAGLVDPTDPSRNLDGRAEAS